MAEQWILNGPLMAWMGNYILFRPDLRQLRVDKARKILNDINSLRPLKFSLKEELLGKKLEQEKPKLLMICQKWTLSIKVTF